MLAANNSFAEALCEDESLSELAPISEAVAPAVADFWFYKCQSRPSRKTNPEIDQDIAYRKGQIDLLRIELIGLMFKTDKASTERKNLINMQITSYTEDMLRLTNQKLTPITAVYEWLYIGKDMGIQANGICHGWSRFSDYCTYTTDANGNDLYCNDKNINRVIKTP